MKINGKMITLARETRGMSQAELAQKIGSPQSVLSDIETGKLQPDATISSSISKALKYPTGFFLNEKCINRLSKFYYRKRETFPAKKIGTLEAQMEVIRLVYSNLIKQVEFRHIGLPQIPVTKTSTPEKIAEHIRLFFNLDDSPIEKPFSLIERIGIPVIRMDVDSDKFSGMTIQTDANIPIIIVNKNLPADHQKFTLFHELGHLIMHVPFTDDPEFYDILQDKEVIEKQADHFAGAFMMPKGKALLTFKPLTYQRLTDLKLYWKASKQSIIYRAKDIGLIDERKWRNLYIEISRHGERKNENIKITIDEPSLIKKIVSVYKEQLNYSVDSLAEEIGLDTEDFYNWFIPDEQPLFKISYAKFQNDRLNDIEAS